MNFHEVYLVNRRLERLDHDAIVQLGHLISPIPAGYEEFLSTLGFGTFCDFITLLRPSDIADKLHSVRECVNHVLKLFTADNAIPSGNFAECVPIAISDDGDYLVICPDRPKEIFAIPRHDDAVYQLPEGLGDLLRWKRSTDGASKYVYQPPFQYFESFIDRSRIELFTAREFTLSAVADSLLQRWKDLEVRAIPGETVVLLFPRAIDGRVQLTQSHGDPRVGIHISFDRQHKVEVNHALDELQSQGFYVTRRTD